MNDPVTLSPEEREDQTFARTMILSAGRTFLAGAEPKYPDDIGEQIVGAVTEYLQAEEMAGFAHTAILPSCRAFLETAEPRSAEVAKWVIRAAIEYLDGEERAARS